MNIIWLNLPIRLDAFPVKAVRRTLGQLGWWPAFLSSFSACMEIALIVWLFPTPAPPWTMILQASDFKPGFFSDFTMFLQHDITLRMIFICSGTNCLVMWFNSKSVGRHIFLYLKPSNRSCPSKFKFPVYEKLSNSGSSTFARNSYFWWINCLIFCLISGIL